MQMHVNPIKVRVDITMVEAAHGVKKEINIVRKSKCGTCSGKGYGKDGGINTCGKCNGQGKILRTQGQFQVVTPCYDCGGTGRKIKNKCTKCNGDGLAKEDYCLTAEVPSGAPNEGHFEIEGVGDQRSVSSLSRGNVIVFVRHVDKYFSSEGLDIKCRATISVADAMLGCELEMPTLYGKRSLKIPAGVSSGVSLKTSGYGLRLMGHKGDQYVEIKVDIPKLENLDNVAEKIEKSKKADDCKVNREKIIADIKSFVGRN